MSVLAGVIAFFAAKLIGKETNKSKRDPWQQDVARRRQAVEHLASEARAAVKQIHGELTGIASLLPGPTAGRDVVAS
jgi:hypothetical protein